MPKLIKDCNLNGKNNKQYQPPDLVALTHLVHAIRENSKSSEEDGHSTGPLVWDTTGVPDRRKATGRRAILQGRHVLHACHPWLIPYRRLRHVCSFSVLRPAMRVVELIGTLVSFDEQRGGERGDLKKMRQRNVELTAAVVFVCGVVYVFRFGC